MPNIYELRFNGVAIERSENVVSLYWKARRLVNGKPGFAEVETVEGPSYVNAIFSDAILREWERR